MPRDVYICQCKECQENQNSRVIELHRSLNMVMASSDEKHRRLYAAIEAMRLGWGGIKQVSEITGIDRNTITRGLEELRSGSVVENRIREEGGGRKLVEKKRSSDSIRVREDDGK